MRMQRRINSSQTGGYKLYLVIYLVQPHQIGTALGLSRQFVREKAHLFLSRYLKLVLKLVQGIDLDCFWTQAVPSVNNAIREEEFPDIKVAPRLKQFILMSTSSGRPGSRQCEE